MTSILSREFQAKETSHKVSRSVGTPAYGYPRSNFGRNFIQSEISIPVNMRTDQAVDMMVHFVKNRHLEQKSAQESQKNSRNHTKRIYK